MSGERRIGEHPPEPEITNAEKIQAIIDEEVRKDIAHLVEEGDEETAEFFQGVMQDLRESTYSFLSWVNRREIPQRVLYPASGFDQIPKLAFGEDKVVHTSLEGRRGEDKVYFDQLGPGLKVIADNRALPFRDESFDVICLLDSQEDIIGNDHNEYLRVLQPEGLILLSKNHMLNPEDERIDTYMSNPSLEPVPVLDNLQMRGEAQVEFAILRKRS